MTLEHPQQLTPHPNPIGDSDTLNSVLVAQDFAESPLSDTQTLNRIRAFVRAAKPEELSAVDVLQVVHLLSRKAEDHAIYDSQGTLATCFAVDVKTIARSQERLVRAGWLTKPKRRGGTNALYLAYENLPFAEPQNDCPTDAAKQFAFRYKQALLKGFKRKKFPRGWLQAQHVSAQRILNRCGGNFDHAIRVLTHAANHPQHRKAMKSSLYNVLLRWSKIMATYAAATPAPQEAA